jgi:tRNA nucleotidyltransferase/poly(A) polymerase
VDIIPYILVSIANAEGLLLAVSTGAVKLIFPNLYFRSTLRSGAEQVFAVKQSCDTKFSRVLIY